MKIVVLAENYPHPMHPETQAYIHSRSVYYREKGLQVEVISFRAKEPYTIDEIRVFPPSHIVSIDSVDLCISHAPNLRNHVRYLRANLTKIRKLLFVFHGYEGLHTKHRSIAPSIRQKKLFARYFLNYAYDYFKLPILRYSIAAFKKKLPVYSFIVSESLLSDMKRDLRITEAELAPFFIINNPINPAFNSSTYSYSGPDDIVCIRNLDDRKYGADLFVEVARRNPQRNFHLYGKGHTFDNVVLPSNLKIIKRYFLASAMIELLKKYRAAILFTRWDSQGILACEFAALGIPLLASDLPICREMLSAYSNVGFVPNDLSFDLENELSKLSPANKKVVRYTYEETTAVEVEKINEILS